MYIKGKTSPSSDLGMTSSIDPASNMSIPPPATPVSIDPVQNMSIPPPATRHEPSIAPVSNMSIPPPETPHKPSIAPVSNMSIPPPATPHEPDLPKHLEENDLSPETKDLISILPKEKCWVAGHMHKYQGYWYTPNMLQGVLACQKHFKSKDTDILVVTPPKAGTTWLKAISFAIVKRTRYPPNTQDHPLLTENPHTIVRYLDLDLYAKDQIPDLTSNEDPSPSIFSTHISFASLPQSVKDSACKVVYLCRNPKDVLLSNWHFSNKLRAGVSEVMPLEEAVDMFCREVSAYGPFWDHVLGYWKETLERPDKVFFLKYEELKEEPGHHLRRLAEFLGCPFSRDEEAQGMVASIIKLCSFQNLSNLEVNKTGKLWTGVDNSVFYRRGEAGGWKKELTPEMTEQIDRTTEEKLQGSGFKF